MITLTAAFDSLLAAAATSFPQRRTFHRAYRLAYGFVTAWGRRTISGALCALHAQFEDWTANYRVFSRSPWEPRDLFQPVIQKCVSMVGETGPIAIAMDDTMVKKTSKRIPGVSYGRDPMSPPFHPNLALGQRFIQAAVILRPEGIDGPARTIPVRFHPAPPPAKPKKKASEDEWTAYRHAKKTQNLSRQGVQVIKDVRESLDEAGCKDRTVLLVTDGSYCNRTVLGNVPDKVEVIARARGDVTLCVPPTAEQLVGRGRRRKYGDNLPKPKDIRSSDEFPWQEAKIFGAGRLHDLRFKVVSNVLWRSGTRARPLRLIIIAPLGYRRTKKSRILYRDPAYLLTTDLATSVEILIQAYFDRWEIEVNHRDEKSLLGVGDAQVWSDKAAPRVPQFQVAVYAMLLLASLMACGPDRTERYHALPKWDRREPSRPSITDIITLLREELLDKAIPTAPNTTRKTGGRPSTRQRGVRIAS